jgi:ApbE superfamily uncharacterized protein (UPF0280 family)
VKGQERIYRRIVRGALPVACRVVVRETDLQIYSRQPLADLARDTVLTLRGHLDGYIRRHPDFVDTLDPWPADDPAPPVVRAMIAAGRLAGVGPMAAVAGAVAEGVGRVLLDRSDEVIVENGGDIFAITRAPLVIGLFAGDSPVSLKLGLRVAAHGGTVAICTSSGTVGHSLSFGRADAVSILSADCALADAAATAVGNRVKEAADIGAAIDFARSIPGVSGVVIVCGRGLGAWGAVELVPLSPAAAGRERGKRG